MNWVGFQPYSVFQKLLLEHHIFLSPSVTARDGDSEGGAPVSIIEAAATGMPVVASTHADIPEVVVDGESALLSPERDVDALAQNLERLVTEPHVWEPMGRRGRAHVQRPISGINHVTNPIADHPAAERHPTTPVPGDPERRVGPKRHRPDP